jgi:hypothetical protein
MSLFFSDDAVTDEEMAFMRAQDGGVIMAGRTWYSDIFGEPHSTDFCKYTLKGGAISDCGLHNEILKGHRQPVGATLTRSGQSPKLESKTT